MKIKQYILILLTIVLAGCDSENAPGCFRAAGTIVQEQREVANFTKILAWQRTQVFIEQGPEHKVIIESGENLMDDVVLTVEEGRLNIYNNNACNLVRDYQITKIFVTAPNITEIRSSTGYEIRSIGTLRYPQLTLLSEDQNNEDFYHTNGDFYLDLAVENLSITANGLSRFYLSGSATFANFGLFGSDCGIEAGNLIVQDLNIVHRSTDRMVVNPQNSITGRIVSYGNCISKNRPPIVAVETPFEGRLIFE